MQLLRCCHHLMVKMSPPKVGLIIVWLILFFSNHITGHLPLHPSNSEHPQYLATTTTREEGNHQKTINTYQHGDYKSGHTKELLSFTTNSPFKYVYKNLNTAKDCTCLDPLPSPKPKHNNTPTAERKLSHGFITFLRNRNNDHIIQEMTKLNSNIRQITTKPLYIEMKGRKADFSMQGKNDVLNSEDSINVNYIPTIETFNFDGRNRRFERLPFKSPPQRQNILSNLPLKSAEYAIIKNQSWDDTIDFDQKPGNTSMEHKINDSSTTTNKPANLRINQMFHNMDSKEKHSFLAHILNNWRHSDELHNSNTQQTMRNNGKNGEDSRNTEAFKHDIEVEHNIFHALNHSNSSNENHRMDITNSYNIAEILSRQSTADNNFPLSIRNEGIMSENEFQLKTADTEVRTEQTNLEYNTEPKKVNDDSINKANYNIPKLTDAELEEATRVFTNIDSGVTSGYAKAFVLKVFNPRRRSKFLAHNTDESKNTEFKNYERLDSISAHIKEDVENLTVQDDTNDHHYRFFTTAGYNLHHTDDIANKVSLERTNAETTTLSSVNSATEMKITTGFHIGGELSSSPQFTPDKMAKYFPSTIGYILRAILQNDHDLHHNTTSKFSTTYKPLNYTNEITQTYEDHKILVDPMKMRNGPHIPLKTTAYSSIYNDKHSLRTSTPHIQRSTRSQSSFEMTKFDVNTAWKAVTEKNTMGNKWKVPTRHKSPRISNIPNLFQLPQRRHYSHNRDTTAKNEESQTEKSTTNSYNADFETHDIDNTESTPVPLYISSREDTLQENLTEYINVQSKTSTESNTFQTRRIYSPGDGSHDLEDLVTEASDSIETLDEKARMPKMSDAVNPNNTPFKKQYLFSKDYYEENYDDKTEDDFPVNLDYVVPEFRPGSFVHFKGPFPRQPVRVDDNYRTTSRSDLRHSDESRYQFMVKDRGVTPAADVLESARIKAFASTFYPFRLQDITMKFASNREIVTPVPASATVKSLDAVTKMEGFESRNDEETEEYKDENEPWFTMEKLAYLLIGTCCGLSILCLCVVVIAIKCRRCMVERRVRAQFRRQLYHHDRNKTSPNWQKQFIDQFMYLHNKQPNSSCSSRDSCNCRCVTWSLGARNLDTQPICPTRNSLYMCRPKNLPFGAASTLRYESMLGRRRQLSTPLPPPKGGPLPKPDSSNENDSLEEDSNPELVDMTCPKQCTCIGPAAWVQPEELIQQSIYGVCPTSRLPSSKSCLRGCPDTGMELRHISRDCPPPVSGSNYLDRAEGVVYWSSNDERLI